MHIASLMHNDKLSPFSPIQSTGGDYKIGGVSSSADPVTSLIYKVPYPQSA